MDRTRIPELLHSIRNVNIGVLGDFCLDCYWDLDTGTPEVSIETGRQTRAVQQQRYTPGGAGNVVSNLLALGVREVHAFGIIGDDLFGRELMRHLQERGVTNEGLAVQQSGWDTAVYAKPYLGPEEQERIDFGRFNRITPSTEDRVLSKLRKEIQGLDALIINQQLINGVCSPRLISELNALALSRTETIFLLDSRNHRLGFRNMACKLNAAEAARTCGISVGASQPIPSSQVKEFARQISARMGKPVFITRSSDGIIALDAAGCWEISGVSIAHPVDPVGAGDTTVAAIAATLAAAGTVEEAASIANLAAAVTVQKLRQTGTATPSEILEIASPLQGKNEVRP